MGLASDLGYEVAAPNAMHRAMQAFGASRFGAWLFSKTLRHVDDVMTRLTQGRTTVPELLAGLPVLELTTTGRRSGQRRTSHLLAVPVGDTLALLGTNFGQTSTPAWALNLETDPRAEVSFRGRARRVTARAATPTEESEIRLRADGIYPGYRKYGERITGRRVRIFVLDPEG